MPDLPTRKLLSRVTWAVKFEIFARPSHPYRSTLPNGIEAESGTVCRDMIWGGNGMCLFEGNAFR